MEADAQGRPPAKKILRSIEISGILRLPKHGLIWRKTEMTAETSKAKPVDEIRLGTVKAAIWKNDTAAGVRHSVTFERLYRDGESWESSQSFGRDEVLLLGKVADLAHTRIFELQDAG